MPEVRRSYFATSIEDFLAAAPEMVLGTLARENQFDLGLTQRDAWEGEIQSLKQAVSPFIGRGGVIFEYTVPRLGRRIDVVLVVDHALFVLEFKVGEEDFRRDAVEQVWDYALDLKNFHSASRDIPIIPVLVATRAESRTTCDISLSDDGVAIPICTNLDALAGCIKSTLSRTSGKVLVWSDWHDGQYSPTPTIIEAAKALYAHHSVEALSRRDASAKNLARTSGAVSEVIRKARDLGTKAICFVTGVPGSGKTLVGLDVATRHMDADSELHSVYLSGNGPLVAILQEALARDEMLRSASLGTLVRKGKARQKVEAFIQNVHHFRDDCLDNPGPPTEHVAIFDEAQRAWNRTKTIDFMVRKKRRSGFNHSESEFLVSCLDRHDDWAVVVCLVGGGQEINTGEAGIAEWITSVEKFFPMWTVHISPQLHDSEYGVAKIIDSFPADRLVLNPDLHLSVSMRSFRAERLSLFVKKILDIESAQAAAALKSISKNYPIRLSRDLTKAKTWLREMARGSERYGIVVSSQAQRLRPLAIDVRAPMDPVHWFLDDKKDIRSSYFLEDVATEFDVQGLELDWACVVWDGDFRFADESWQHHSFVGDRWQRILKPERQSYLKNAYRVLLTRARQGMVIVVPEGSGDDETRARSYYDGTFEYLKSIGVAEL